ncbi:hypothetical protein V6N13_147566 [Hibiscus sabdariffa]
MKTGSLRIKLPLRRAGTQMEEDDYNDDDRSHMERNKMKKSDEEYADYWAGNGNAITDNEIVVDVPKLEVLKYK